MPMGQKYEGPCMLSQAHMQTLTGLHACTDIQTQPYLQVVEDALLVKIGARHTKHACKAACTAQPAGAACHAGGGDGGTCAFGVRVGCFSIGSGFLSKGTHVDVPQLLTVSGRLGF